MVRILSVLLLVAWSAPALAADGFRYENARYGFVIDIPPGFADTGDVGDGDGDVFTSDDGTARLTVAGGSVLAGSFNAEWERRQAAYRDDGWTIRYEPVAPDWTTFTGLRADRRLVVKLLPLCGGTRQFAMFALEYPAAAAAALTPVVERLSASLTRAGTGLSC
ncbi:MAG TPA: hypothetical protein GYA10_13040 [Alphaproteobacteria bacterium]|nr:hypothetical protein [Alphaproteobacteria bacterium]